MTRCADSCRLRAASFVFGALCGNRVVGVVTSERVDMFSLSRSASRPSVSDSQPANDFDLADLLDELPPLVTREESAELLRVSLSTIDRWRLSGKLGSRTIGRRVYITRRSIFALLAIVAVVITSLVAIEAVDLIVPRSDFGVPPGMGHPLEVALDSIG